MFKFERLNAWKDSINLFSEITEIVDKIPHKYQSSIGDQIRHSCLSISANIAEATGREGSNRNIIFLLRKGQCMKQSVCFMS
jgi:four helix bundle protein